jgi:integrase/recombinase XerD
MSVLQCCPTMKEQIQAFLEWLKNTKGYSRNTVEAYHNDLNQFLNFATGERPQINHWNRVDKGILLSFVQYLKDRGYTASSAARKIAVIKTFFHYLVNHAIVTDDPTATLGSPKVQKRVPQILSPVEIDRLMTAVANRSNPKGFRDRAILEMLYATGVRVTELVSFDVGSVDLESKTAQCAMSDNKQRVIPMSERATEALSDYLKRGRTAFVTKDDERALFVNPHGDRLTRQGLWLIIREYVKDAGITIPVTPHTLRHSFAVHQLNNGADMQSVQRLLGHANVATTQAYARMMEHADKPRTED